MMITRGHVLLKSGTLFISNKQLDYLYLKQIFKYERELSLKQPLTSPQGKIIATYCTSNHRLAIETRRWSIIPISRDTKLCYFYSYSAVENEAHFMLKCPLYKPIRNKFPSLFENVIIGSLPFTCTTKFILASNSRGLPHFAILEN